MSAILNEARSADSGLVSISTSDTPVFEIDSEAARLKKMKRRVCKAAELHQKSAKLRPAMVTATYERNDTWAPRHISEALKRVRQWMARRGHDFRYVWTAELQQRGAVHYHIVCWLPDGRGEKPPFWDAQGWWPHGSTRSEWATNAVGYIAKYVSKVSSKDRLPGGARMHGSGGFTKEERLQMRFHSRPTWLRELTQMSQKVVRPQGGGAVLHYLCGLKRKIASPFVLLARLPGRVVLARREVITQEVQDVWKTWTKGTALACLPMPKQALSC